MRRHLSRFHYRELQTQSVTRELHCNKNRRAPLRPQRQNYPRNTARAWEVSPPICSWRSKLQINISMQIQSRPSRLYTNRPIIIPPGLKRRMLQESFLVRYLSSCRSGRMMEKQKANNIQSMKMSLRKVEKLSAANTIHVSQLTYCRVYHRLGCYRVSVRENSAVLLGRRSARPSPTQRRDGGQGGFGKTRADRGRFPGLCGFGNCSNFGNAAFHSTPSKPFD